MKVASDHQTAVTVTTSDMRRMWPIPRIGFCMRAARRSHILSDGNMYRLKYTDLILPAYFVWVRNSLSRPYGWA
jgi:hypothetical protein